MLRIVLPTDLISVLFYALNKIREYKNWLEKFEELNMSKSSVYEYLVIFFCYFNLIILLQQNLFIIH